MRSRLVAWIAVLALLAGAAYAVRGWLPLRELRRLVERTVSPGTPHDRYVRQLQDGGLAETALGRDFVANATRALAEPAKAPLPFEQIIETDAAAAPALGFALPLERGQQLTASATLDDARVFIDLFGPEPPGTEAAPVISAEDEAREITFEVPRTGSYVLRVQPELLRGGALQLTIATGPSLQFPVSGAGLKSIQSLFGDPRDAGRREHEGVDIFATRGTPVFAAADGLVTRVGENNLGGNVVWVWAPSRGLLLYYAHLHEQLVSSGQRVRAGEVLGTVGNTGNARTTPPHLHFGIYEPGSGAIDPAPFIRPADKEDADP